MFGATEEDPLRESNPGSKEFRLTGRAPPKSFRRVRQVRREQPMYAETHVAAGPVYPTTSNLEHLFLPARLQSPLVAQVLARKLLLVQRFGLVHSIHRRFRRSHEEFGNSFCQVRPLPDRVMWKLVRPFRLNWNSDCESSHQNSQGRNPPKSGKCGISRQRLHEASAVHIGL